jgi:hypothetical protein
MRNNWTVAATRFVPVPKSVFLTSVNSDPAKNLPASDSVSDPQQALSSINPTLEEQISETPLRSTQNKNIKSILSKDI